MEANPARIMFLIDKFETAYAGTEGQLLHLITQLQAAGVEVEVTLLRPSEYIEAHGLPCPWGVLHIYKMFSLSTLRKLRAFAQILQRRDFSILHIYFNDTAVIGPPVLAWHGIKIVVSRRDMGFWYTPMVLWLLRVNSLLVDKVIANCQAVKEHVHRQEWISRRKIDVIYNGYQSRALPDQNATVEKRRELAIPAGKLVVGMVANLRPIKRIPDLIDAAAQLRRDDVVFVIVGGGDAEPLLAYGRERGVSEQFIFAGSRQDVSELLPLFDIAVLCSESEGFSNAIVEYMQAGRAVICSDVGDNSEIVDHERMGFLYPKGNVAELAGYLTILLDNPQRAVAMGSAARAKVIERLNMETMVQQHLASYRQLLT